MAAPKQQQNSNGDEQKEILPISKELDTTNRKATEELLKKMFIRHKELPEASNNELTHELSRAFQLFRSDFSYLPSPSRNNEKERKIRERISALQKRTSETFKVLTDCKENVSSIIFIDTKSEKPGDIDEPVTSETRTLDELTKEIEKIQSGTTNSSVTKTERPDIEEMKNATDQLLGELGRISKSYASENTKTSWLSKSTGKRQ